MLPTIRFFFIILICTLLAGFFIVPLQTMPDHAIVWLDDQHKTYLSPKCAPEDRQHLRVGRAAEARQLKYQPDQACDKAAGFTQPTRSISGNFFTRLGMLPPLPSRWNPDGTWNW
jgi:hypothetical protein